MYVSHVFVPPATNSNKHVSIPTDRRHAKMYRQVESRDSNSLFGCKVNLRFHDFDKPVLHNLSLTQPFIGQTSSSFSVQRPIDYVISILYCTIKRT